MDSTYSTAKEGSWFWSIFNSFSFRVSSFGSRVVWLKNWKSLTTISLVFQLFALWDLRYSLWSHAHLQIRWWWWWDWFDLLNLKIFEFWHLIIPFIIYRILLREFMWHHQTSWPLPVEGNYVIRGVNLVLLSLRLLCGIRCVFTPKVSWQTWKIAGVLNPKFDVVQLPYTVHTRIQILFHYCEVLF